VIGAASGLRRIVRSICGLFLGGFIVLVLLEGLSSVFYFAARLYRDRAIAEERHTRYDPELGWVSEPNLVIPDMYGPGIALHTNAQGFRGQGVVPGAIPPGHRRAICSGDSYTLGYGVDDDHTWCHILGTLPPGIETVNMGQGGYGIDQAYLWFRRDGAALEHQIHVFAFVTDDFRRMQSDRFLGYGKPLLVLRGSTLAVTNVPVPPPRPFLRWLNAHAGHLQLLSTVRLGRAIADELHGPPAPALDKRMPQAVAGRLFEELLASDRAKKSGLLLVYLPTPSDYRSCEADDWRRFTSAKARLLGIPFLDLVAELRRLPAAEVDDFFIKSSQVQYFGAAGHYTAKGNAWVAHEIHSWMERSENPR
jgi:hypothetical protein